MKKFSIWVKENKQWNEEGEVRFRAKPIVQTVSPQQTVHIHPATSNKPLAPTISHIPQDDTHHDYHDDPVVNQLLNIVKNNIDGLTWDYGKDTVETAIASVLDSVPHAKAQCDHLTGCWKRFKNALYKELRENQNPWWGAPRNGPPNPVIYDSALLRLKDIEKIFEEIKRLCSECEKDEINQLFLTFIQEYDRIIPGMKSIIERFRKNTPRK